MQYSQEHLKTMVYVKFVGGLGGGGGGKQSVLWGIWKQRMQLCRTTCKSVATPPMAYDRLINSNQRFYLHCSG